jgi:capsular polysaccharide biosynthesis protein
MSEQSLNQHLVNDISLKDIIDFLVESWRKILCVGILGLLSSLGFLAVTPSQYEAIAQIQMAQVNSNKNTNPFGGAVVEDPKILIKRLKLPTTYSAEEIKACGFEKEKMPAEALTEMIKPSILNDASSIVELKIRLKSRDQAAICAQAIFENIRETQNQIIKPYIEEAKDMLTKYQARLKEIQVLMIRPNSSGEVSLAATYLANQDEVKVLREESIRLNAFVAPSKALQTKLISPIYASEAVIFPKKKVTLIIGLLAGLFLGLLLVIILKVYSNYQVSQRVA